MSDCTIAMSLTYFDEDSAWLYNSFKRRAIMSIPIKYWIAVFLYLTNLWRMSFLIIMVTVKLL